MPNLDALSIIPKNIVNDITKMDITTKEDVNIAGGFGGAQLTSNYIQANGIRLPSKRRAYTREPDNRPILDMLMVAIDISNVSHDRFIFDKRSCSEVQLLHLHKSSKMLSSYRHINYI